MEVEMSEKTNEEYAHEVLADWGEESAGVFQKAYVDAALRNYTYESQFKQPDWSYTMGIDWNPIMGTQIYVTGAREEMVEGQTKTIFRTVDVGEVSLIGWTEIKSVSEIVRLFRKWGPEAIYLDNGGGGHLAVQLLHQIGAAGLTKKEHPMDGYLLKIVKGLDMGSSIETKDPWTKETIKRPLKPFTISNAVRRFEQKSIEISQYDKLLIRQLEGYVVDRISQSGQPIFVASDETVGDHKLDALTFALLAFTMEKTQIGRLSFSENIGIIGEAINNPTEDEKEEQQAMKKILADAKAEAMKRRVGVSDRSSAVGNPGNFGSQPKSDMESPQVHHVSWGPYRPIDRSSGIGVKSNGSGRSNF